MANKKSGERGVAARNPLRSSPQPHLPSNAAAAMLLSTAGRGAGAGSRAEAARGACAAGRPAGRLPPAISAQRGAPRVHACAGFECG